ncbi:MAG: reverse transcriptase domain-containing protein, partial [Hyphomicrobiales bacterium]
MKADGRFKARLVVQGWAQQHGIDLLFEPFVMKLRKSLYGLRQSPNIWNKTIDNDLREMGFAPTISDPCVYTKGHGESYTMLTLFVDDLLTTGPSDKIVNMARDILMAKFAMTDLGNVSQILGIEINRDGKEGTIELTPRKYTISLLKRFNMSDCNPVHTPGTGKELASQPEGSMLLDEIATKGYQAIVGSLIFLTQCTRFDIAFSTMQAARHMSKPTNIHMASVKRILRYLKGTPSMPIVYKRAGSFNLFGYCDTSYGQGDPDKMSSVSGCLFFIAGGLAHFSSQLQKISAQSSSEAEL